MKNSANISEYEFINENSECFHPCNITRMRHRLRFRYN